MTWRRSICATSEAARGAPTAKVIDEAPAMSPACPIEMPTSLAMSASAPAKANPCVPTATLIMAMAKSAKGVRVPAIG